MLRTSRTTGSLRDLARATQATAEPATSSVLPSFLRSKADPNSWLQVATDGMHPNFGLHHAAATGNVGLVKFALENGQPHSSLLNGLLPLHAACSGGDEATVRLLLKHGANVNATRRKPDIKSTKIIDTEGSTPLHFAAANGHTHIVRLLLERGASPAPRDRAGFTPEALATSHKHLECVSLIRVWITTKGPVIGKEDETTDSRQVDEKISKRPLKSQRSIDSFASAASSIKTSLRSRRRSQSRREGCRQLSTSVSRTEAAPPLPQARPLIDASEPLRVTIGKHRNMSGPGLSQTIDTAYGQKEPPFLSPQSDVLASAHLDSKQHENTMRPPDGLKVESSDVGSSLLLKSLQVPDSNVAKQSSPSPSFLPSLESSTDSYFGCKVVASESAAEDDSQELLEASTDLCSPYHYRARTYSASSSNSKHLKQPPTQRLTGSRGSSSPSVTSLTHTSYTENRMTKQRDVLAGHSTRHMKPRSLRGNFDEEVSSTSHLPPSSDFSINDSSTSKSQALGSVPHLRTGSRDSFSNRSVISSLSMTSAPTHPPSTERTQPLIQSIEEDIKALPRSASQASLQDMLEAYGEALALHRQASTKSIVKKPSSASLQSNLFAEMSLASRVQRKYYERDNAQDNASLRSTPSRSSRPAMREEETSLQSKEVSSRAVPILGDSNASLSSHSAGKAGKGTIQGVWPLSSAPSSSAHQDDPVLESPMSNVNAEIGANSHETKSPSDPSKSSKTRQSESHDDNDRKCAKSSSSSSHARHPMSLSTTCPTRTRMRAKDFPQSHSLSHARSVPSLKPSIDSQISKVPVHDGNGIPIGPDDAASDIASMSSFDELAPVVKPRRPAYHKILGEPNLPSDLHLHLAASRAHRPEDGVDKSLPLAPPSPDSPSKSPRRAKRKVRDVLNGIKSHIAR